MEKIINGIAYNTNTAKEIDSDCNELPMSDFCYIEETLYQKDNGEFFLHGNGGARTAYRTLCSDGSLRGGEDIVPLSVDEAKLWIERHSTFQIYKTLFGVVSE